MDIFLYILAVVLVFIGTIGCVVPILPGPPIAFLGLLSMQISSQSPFSLTIMLTMGILALLITLIDYFAPGLGTKYSGGSKFGTWGCFIGTIFGVFLFPPISIIIMPFLGALIGELFNKTSFSQSLKAAFGAFAGFLCGTLLKIIFCISCFGFIIWAFFQ